MTTRPRHITILLVISVLSFVFCHRTPSNTIREEIDNEYAEASDIDCAGFFDVEGDIQKGQYQLLLYGLINLDEFEMQQKVAHRYGFQFKSMGCVVDSFTGYCSEQYNERMIHHLEGRNGLNWFPRFRASVDSMRNVTKSR